MKTTVSKDIYHSLLVSEDDLRRLFLFLQSKYNHIQLTGDCNDGSSLETEDIEDILKFENINYRKLISIKFKATNELDDIFLLGMYADRFRTSDIYMNSKNDERVVYIFQEIKKRLDELKPAYDVITQIPVLLMVVVPLTLVGLGISIAELAGIIDIVYKSEPTIYEYINRTLILGLSLFLLTYPFELLRKFLFPKVFFLIGKQKVVMENIKKFRSFIFITLIIGTLLGIGVNWLSNYLFD